ncbi:Guanine nucleotide-binding protein-like 3 [Boothiomyces sp. JEL0866]|nr:Guanine nucleotide-binding protein-like 3 [Boothiomyces sp. JEL0866]
MVCKRVSGQDDYFSEENKGVLEIGYFLTSCFIVSGFEHKSKRQTGRDRYKIIKRVAEKHRKDRKEAKKHPNKKSKKDPGVPNNFPFKEEILMEADDLKQQKLLEKEKKKQEKLAKQQQAEEEMELDHQETRGPRTLKKSYKHYSEILKDSNIILIVLDARDPLYCYPKEIEQSKNKKIIIALSKVDLVPKESVSQWIAYFKYPVIPFSTNMDIDSVTLLQAAIDKFKVKAGKLGIIGYPHTGKSNILYQIKGLENVEIEKSTGIIFSKTEKEDESSLVLLRNYTIAKSIPNPQETVTGIFKRFTDKQLMQLYKIHPYQNYNDVLVQIAKHKNYVRRSGLDLNSTARAIMNDFYEYRIPYYTVPDSGKSDSKIDLTNLKCESEFEKIFKIKTVGPFPVDAVPSLPKEYQKNETVVFEESEDEVESMDEDVEIDEDVQVDEEIDNEDLEESEEFEEDDEELSESLADGGPEMSDEESENADVEFTDLPDFVQEMMEEGVAKEDEEPKVEESKVVAKKQKNAKQEQKVAKKQKPEPKKKSAKKATVSNEDYDFGEHF